MGAASTLVRLRVECCTRLAADRSGPSERLARMMEKNESKVLQRLKGYIESQRLPGSVLVA